MLVKITNKSVIQSIFNDLLFSHRMIIHESNIEIGNRTTMIFTIHGISNDVYRISIGKCISLIRSCHRYRHPGSIELAHR